MTLPEAALPLAEWESLYVIIGTSAAALTGLMFVVIAVVADAGPRAATPQGIATFVTPTIFHFCAALMISWSAAPRSCWCSSASTMPGTP